MSPWVLRKCVWVWTCPCPYTSVATSTRKRWQGSKSPSEALEWITRFCIRFDFTFFFSSFWKPVEAPALLCSYPGCVILYRELVVVDRWLGQPFDVTWSYTHASSMGWIMAREQWLIGRDVPSAALAVASFKWLDYILIMSPLKM